jgi:hypothetical protein
MRCLAYLLPLRRAAALLVLALAFSASGANATPVFFDGPTGRGTSEETAAGSGLPELTFDSFVAAGDYVAVLDQSGDGLILQTRPPDGDFEHVSTWTLQSLMSLSAIGDPYLVFFDISNRDVDGLGTTSYLDEEVALDPAEGPSVGDWAIIRRDELGELYLGISLGDLLDAEGKIDFIVLNYFLTDAIPDNLFEDGDDFIVALPKLHLGIAFNAIPEPGTGLLLTFGLVGLAATRRRS